MRVDVDLLKRSIAASGKTKETVAKEIGIDYSTFTRKMNCDALAFSVGQMHKLVAQFGYVREVIRFTLASAKCKRHKKRKNASA